ncbi:Protein AAT-6 b [Aphelenchoides avenae]|nr:Protein AAT-6 b [Aphelenchus avenae]
MTNHNKMGLMGATAYIIGNVVGSGLFVSPGTILGYTNSVGLSLVIWVAAALLSMLGAFCYVELGTSIRRSGANYAYLCYVKWYPIAFGFMCIGCIITYPGTLAIQMDAFSEYIFQGAKIKLEPTTEFYAKKLLGFALVWLLLFLNFFSVKTTVSRFQIAASIAQVTATVLVIGTGFYFLVFKGKTENLQQPFHNSSYDAGKIVSAMFAGLFAYDGWDILNFGAEEIENPRRTMKLAILIGMTLVAVLFIAINVSFFVVLPTHTILTNGKAIAATFAQETLGPAQYILPICVGILLVGSLNSTMFSGSRYLYAAARQRHLPSFISCINKQVDSPRAALVFHVLLAMLISFIGDLDALLDYTGFCYWIQRFMTMIALMYIRFWHVPIHPEAIRMPIIMPILFMICCGALTVTTIVQDWSTARVGLGVILAGLIIFTVFIWDKTLNRFAIYRRVSGAINVAMAICVQIVLNGMVDVSGHEEEESSGANKSRLSVDSSGRTRSDSGIVDDCVLKKKF